MKTRQKTKENGYISAFFRTKQIRTRRGKLSVMEKRCKPTPMVSILGETLLSNPGDVILNIKCQFMDDSALNLKLLDELTATLRDFIKR